MKSTFDFLKSASKRIWEIARAIPLVLSLEGEVFASFPFSRDGRMLFPLRSPYVRDWLVARYVEESNLAPDEKAVRNAIRDIDSTARHTIRDRLLVFHRVAAYGERFGPAVVDPSCIVLDLKNENGEVLVIKPDGWEVEPGEHYCFTRGDHMLPLPQPTTGRPPEETLATLRRLLNPATDKDWHRLLIWILSAMRGTGPCPILALHGPHMSGKTTIAQLLRRMIDPTRNSFAQTTLSTRDLTAHVRNNWLLMFDDLRRISPRIGDFMNSVASGMGVETKQPHDRHDPVATTVQRPVLFTVVHDGSPALSGRMLKVNLAPLTKDRLLALPRLWREFEKFQPYLLDLLAHALCIALQNFFTVEQPIVDRFTDAALWTMAAAPAIGLTEAQILNIAT